MKHPLLKLFILFAFTVVLLFSLVGRAEAGRGWVGGDSTQWSVQKTCVNGGLIMGFHGESVPADWDINEYGRLITTVTPYKIDKSPASATTEPIRVTFPNGSELTGTRQVIIDFFEIPRYYRPVGTPETFEIFKESVPLQTSSTSDVLKNYYGYMTDGKLYFHQDLNVGDLVYYSIRVIDTVQDCRIGEKSSEGETTIDLANPAPGIIPDDQLIYTVEQTADSGSLKVGPATQAEGATFTAAEIASQPLIFSGMGGTQTVQISTQATYRASENFDGSQLNGRSFDPSISGNGTEVAFTSAATNVEDLTDGNGVNDVFKRISIGIVPISARFNATTREYEMGDQSSGAPDISPNGVYVAFASDADNLVTTTSCPANSNIFMARHTSDMLQTSCPTADGWIADGTKFGASRPSVPDILEFSLPQERTLVYQTNLQLPTSLVTFDTNNLSDVVGWNSFLPAFSTFSQVAGIPPFEFTTTATGNSGSHSPQISHDGEHVAFESSASNLVSNDNNLSSDIFVRSTSLGLRRVSLNSAGAEADSFSMSPAISRFGEHVAFASAASNLAPDTAPFLFHVYVRDRNIAGDESYDEAGDSCTVLVSKSDSGAVGNGSSTSNSISADGRFIAFVSRADNLVAGDLPTGSGGYTDIFVHDRDADGDGSFYSPSTTDDRCTPGPFRTIRVSVNSYGVAGNDNSFGKPDISANGQFVAFASDATNFVPSLTLELPSGPIEIPGDTNGATDVFVHYLGFTVDLRFSELPPPPTRPIFLPVIVH